MKVSATELISAPRQRVFEIFADIENVAERISGIHKVEILSPVRSGPGVKWRETRVMFGKEATEEMEMTSFDAPKSYVVEANSHGTYYRSVYSFEEVGENETRVTWEFCGTPQTVFSKLMAPLAFVFKGSVRKMLQKDVVDLKRFIEK